jgi:hypothetical protein
LYLVGQIAYASLVLTGPHRRPNRLGDGFGHGWQYVLLSPHCLRGSIRWSSWTVGIGGPSHDGCRAPGCAVVKAATTFLFVFKRVAYSTIKYD